MKKKNKRKQNIKFILKTFLEMILLFIELVVVFTMLYWLAPNVL